MDGMQGHKADDGKAPMALLPPGALYEVAAVLGHGAERYGAHNWRYGLPHSRTLSAALRHIFAFLDGEDVDPDSGRHHLAHAACEVLFALQLVLDGRTDCDDRWLSESRAWGGYDDEV